MQLELIEGKFGQWIELTFDDGQILHVEYDGDAGLPAGLRMLADEVAKHLDPTKVPRGAIISRAEEASDDKV